MYAIRSYYVKHIIFDVDKTIYPNSCGFGDEMDRRISEYAANYINTSLVEADELRKISVKNYGTTLRWLQMEHGLTDTDHYLDFVHPKDVENYLPNVITSYSIHYTKLYE